MIHSPSYSLVHAAGDGEELEQLWGGLNVGDCRSCFFVQFLLKLRGLTVYFYGVDDSERFHKVQNLSSRNSYDKKRVQGDMACVTRQNHVFLDSVRD